MYILLAATFILGYFFIALEHPLKMDKSASAILTGVVCWVILVFGQKEILGINHEDHLIDEAILHHLGEIAQILFFLLGAMTIVELIDSHGGFRIITKQITTTNRIKLFWIIGVVTFFLSAALDNLTTAIVMATLLKKLISEKEDLWFFGGIVVIAANAGGAWSPIGDVTTIMLWIGGQVSALSIIKSIILPSVVCIVVPLTILSLIKKGEIKAKSAKTDSKVELQLTSPFEASLILWLGVAGLLFVPIFKNLTHLPPFMGILFSLGVLWVVTELIHKEKSVEDRQALSVSNIIRRVDTPSVLFFLGILLAVACLQTAGHLDQLAQVLNENIGNLYIINLIIGLISAIVDNVPLVAGAIGMYPLTMYGQDNEFWELLAYCAGTGGSALIIGSAAGVAIMAILKIDFLWYMKKISWLALIGYFSGIITYYIMNAL